jgi:lipoprotein LprG
MHGMQLPRRTTVTSRSRSALAAVAVACALVAGCSSPGSGSSAGETLPDAATILKESAATTKSLTSAHVEVAIDGKIEGLPLKSLSGDLTNVPATAVEGKATIIMSGSPLETGLIVMDGTLFAALSPGHWLDMGPAVDIYDPSTILNPDIGLANMLTSISDAKTDVGERIDATDTVKVSGNVSADAVNKLLPQLKASAAMPGTVWIDKGGDHKLVRARVVPSGDTSIQMTLSDWNKPVTVTKPQV